MSSRKYNDGEWTEAQLRNFAISALRAAFKRYPGKWKALTNGKSGKMVNKLSGRLAEHYKCAGCGEYFVAKQVQVDHKEPVVDTVHGFEDWWTYIVRLYCDSPNLQLLCKPCHKKKTNEERKERKKK